MSRYYRGQPIRETEDSVTLGRLPVISQNFLTPADYFGPGAELPGNYRNERFFQYQDLYDGEHYIVVDQREFPVVFSYFNWFKYGTDLIRDFIMSFPPESSSPLQESLNEALRQAVTHYIIHGVAILAVGDGEQIDVIQPQYFYPLDDDSYAVLIPDGPGRVEVRYSNYSQQFNLDQSDDYNWYGLNGTMGHEVGEPQAEDEREFYTVSADPADGIFGNSVYRELVPAAADFTSINSHFLSQQKIGSLIIVASRQSGNAPAVTLPAAGTEQVKKGATPLRLAQAYGTVIEGYESFNFVQGAIDSDSYRASLDQAEQRIYDIFGISPSLAQRFNNTGLGVASGVALERTYVRSAATFNEIIKSFTPVMEEILQTEITWENPLAALREEAEVEETGSAAPQNDQEETE